jgi:hypothetical protein
LVSAFFAFFAFFAVKNVFIAERYR